MSIATLYTSTACSIDAYRYNILCYLVIMSIVSHLSSVLVLRTYVNGQPIIAIIRFGLVFVQVFFAGIIFSSRVTDSFPTGISHESAAQNTTLVLPAVCFTLAESKPYSGLEDIPHSHHKDIASFSSYIILAVFYIITVIFTIAHIVTHYFKPGSSWEVRHQEERAEKGTWFWWMGLIRGTILLGAWIIWVWAVVNLYKLRGWMDASGWMSRQSLMEDNEWTFGQLLSVFLLGAAPLAVLNAWSGFQLMEEEEERQSVSGFFPLPPAYNESQTEMQRLVR
jgi:magnesium-transporting ATPase (P-type)